MGAVGFSRFRGGMCPKRENLLVRSSITSISTCPKLLWLNEPYLGTRTLLTFPHEYHTQHDADSTQLLPVLGWAKAESGSDWGFATPNTLPGSILLHESPGESMLKRAIRTSVSGQSLHHQHLTKPA